MAITNKVLEFTLELTPGGIPPIIHASQGDVGRTFKANVVWNGSAASAYISGTTVKLRGKKPDKTVFDYAATLSGSSVTFATTEQMTIISGPVECELAFTSGDDVVASANFVLIVEESPWNPDALSESDVDTLGELVSDQIPPAVGDWLEDNVSVAPTRTVIEEATADYIDENGLVINYEDVVGAPDVENYINTTEEAFENGSYTFDFTLTNNNMRTDTGVQGDPNTARTSTPSLYHLPVGCELHTTFNTGYRGQLFCFDENLNYLGHKPIGSLVNGVWETYPGTVYFRVLIVKSDNSDITIEEAKANATYTAVYAGRVATIESELAGAVTLSDIETYTGLNLFNPSAVTLGKEVYSNGTIRDESGSAISDYIPVHNKDFVYIKNLPTYTGSMQRLCFFYDESKAPIGTYVRIPYTDTAATFAVPSGAYYFMFSVYQRSTTTPIDYSRVMVTTEYTDEDFIPYVQYIEKIGDSYIPENKAKTEGLKVVIFGDSITETASMNDDGSNYVEGTRHNWPEYVNTYLSWGSFKNYAKSGAAYKDRGTGYEYRQTVANQISLAMADSNNDDADIIIFSLGTNDGVSNLGSYETAMGKATLADLDTTNLYEALRFAYWTVRNKYKNAVCFSAIPIQRADIEPPTALYEAIEKMAHRYNFIVINGAYQSGIIKENNVWNANGNDLVDGLHPNTTGQVKMAKLYASIITEHYLWNN